ncbi:MAG: tetratricopeptide repeat protein [Candidatus Pelagibacterales bacterium]
MQRISLTIFLIFLMVSISQADQSDPKLEILFNDLSQTQSEMKAQPILLEIWSIWSVAIDTKTQEKFDAGNQLMSKRQYDESILMFSDAINLQPSFAEAWNKRATVNYIIGNYEESISDIFSTLELEPRHFGALDGLAQIYMLQNKYFKAAQVYRKILEILPYNKKAIMHLEYLEQSFI